MFIFFNALAKWSKRLIFKMDIFTNVLRKIFVKGSMHLIYEFKLNELKFNLRTQFNSISQPSFSGS